MAAVIVFTVIPFLATIAGTFWGLLRKISLKWQSAAQHFAAGVVFAAVSVELLPTIKMHMYRFAIFVGFALGVLLMLAIRYLSEALTRERKKSEGFPLGLYTGVAIDLFIDGLLVGIAFLVGEEGGILIGLALTVEVLFLGLSTGSSFKAKALGRPLSFASMSILAILIPIGVFVGYVLFKHVSLPVELGVISFGIAALLYLVTEELLLESHKNPDKPWITGLFFLGYLFIILI